MTTKPQSELIADVIESKTNTMKITITKEVETTIEVSLPVFTTDGNNTYYAILGEDKMITAYYNGKRANIDTFTYKLEEKAALPQITQKEFEDAFVKVFDLLADEFEKMRDAMREKSGVYVQEDLQSDVQQEKAA